MTNPTAIEATMYAQILGLTLEVNGYEIKFMSFVPREKIYLDVKIDRAQSPEVTRVLLDHIRVPFLHASIVKFNTYGHSYFITLLLEQ